MSERDQLIQELLPLTKKSLSKKGKKIFKGVDIDTLSFAKQFAEITNMKSDRSYGDAAFTDWARTKKQAKKIKHSSTHSPHISKKGKPSTAVDIRVDQYRDKSFDKLIDKALTGKPGPAYKKLKQVLTDSGSAAYTSGGDLLIEPDHLHANTDLTSDKNKELLTFFQKRFKFNKSTKKKANKLLKEVKEDIMKPHKKKIEDINADPKKITKVLEKVGEQKEKQKEYGDGTNIPYHIRKPVYNPEEEGNKAAVRALSSVTNDLNMVTKKHSLEDFFNSIIDNEFKK
jgi:hypothetical protein